MTLFFYVRIDPRMPPTLIIGAGIVGLHVAQALHQKGHEVFVLEESPYLAEHTSGRNSGVAHTGIYYETGSLKEKLCCEGNQLTHEWLRKLKVTHLECGKWVIANPGHEDELEIFYKRISPLPIPQPVLKTAAQIKSEEPNLRPTPAIFVPSAFVMDAAGYVKALANFVATLGVQIIQPCRVTGVQDNTLSTTRGPIQFDLAINCAGLFCDDIAKMTGITNYQIKPCRGDYYVASKQLTHRPVYHLPQKGDHALGIHFTPTVDGQTLIGPNAFFIDDKTDYHHRSEVTPFMTALAEDLPGCEKINLTKGFSGNRPRLFKEGKPVTDF
ncbi:MAG TPA: FAD-dependent oxidoreductase, partial [bacterium]|nr:FAD-dependent oxidoreductase [bacterium]